MRLLSTITRTIAIGLPVALLAGCDLMTDSKPELGPSGGTDWEQSTNLESEFGGYEFTDESEAFGDPELRQLELDEASVAVADSGGVPPDSAVVLRVLWGLLEPDPHAPEVLDWSGTIAVSRGALAVRRLIAFEPGDHLLPRPDRRTVAFASHTRPSYDGLVLHVRDAAGDDPTVLRFATGPLTQEWTLADLRDSVVVVPVGAAGHVVSITALPRRPLECPSGFVRGGWLQRDDGRGVLRGVWLSADAVPLGHVRGHFGITASGEHRWFAKILGPGGRLVGLARGTWAPSGDDAVPGGSFRGHWSVRRGVAGGEIQGRYRPGDDAASPGSFEARWQAVCDR